MNGDILTDLDLRHSIRTMSQTTAFYDFAHQREHRIDYGVLHSDADGILRGFEENL
jgi:NDP-sugar pyrophosphorylase family protein